MRILSVARRHVAAATVAVALAAPLAWSAAALAAEADIALIKSFVGDWRGRGEIIWGGTGETETLLCRMDVTDRDVTKIGVDGRCSLAGGVLNMIGTLAWVDQNHRYEAILTSNTAFTGIAVGSRRGERLIFDLRDYEGEDAKYDVNVQVELEGDQIDMDIKIVNKSDGATTLATVPMERR